ncbi:tRNA pseudouridine(55) synthase TruB [candidate division WWE3 bacterium CG08_land_8_20_14_0_20_41_10]|uniref:tRNA pseudouridine synthase B n=1 Tax=candidate division WWE3 bacterium CG08_land_8_20_14_0_20_41_10 TaxID=1975085 RepID=A0A2H0XD13_UNCKA|nr:MAG: tRNA pseudouridine(55) synthase TruB [candidate division WWE3 bacterium CG08_land_8_20_14_0_20_41_10]
MVINVYKPRGWTSNDVVQKIKHACKFKKVGHAGTLDPLAEGVLLILTDADTKRQSEFMSLRKEYMVKIAFGYESDSHDLRTPVRPLGATVANKLTRDALQNALGKYMGKICQQVPAYSAVHVDGKRLYNFARGNQSTTLPLPYKEIEIYDITICSFKNNEQLNYPEIKDEQIICTTAELRVSCGKGTYIRSLVRDLGKDLGCGAVAVFLIRTKVDGYTVENGLPLEKVLLEHLKS